MKLILSICICFLSLFASAQSESLFQRGTETYWLGVDFSKIKLVGGVGLYFKSESNAAKDKMFTKWNDIVLKENKKFNVENMLRKDMVYYDIAYMKEVSTSTDVETMGTLKQPKYTYKDIENMVSKYQIEPKEGLGVLFIAEYFDKLREEACYHFVVISMKDKSIVAHSRLKARASGAGLRNYWANSIYRAMKYIKDYEYKRLSKEQRN